MNKLKKNIVFILITLFFISCTTGLRIRESKTKYFDSNFSATVQNKSFRVIGRRHDDLTLLDLFKIQYDNVDSVLVQFNNKKELQFIYLDNGNKKEKTFAGQFDIKGYYEFYFGNQKIEIPPLIPVFYSKKNINRLRLVLTKEGDLIVDNMWNYCGSIFIIATGKIGCKGRRQSFFKINRNN